MYTIKALQKFLINRLESSGINLSRNTVTLGLTPKSDVISLLARLRPQDNGHALIRIGGAGDGGYLIPDDVTGISECFSPGSNKIARFESELAARWKIKSYICDSQDEKPLELTSLQDFTEAWVGPASDGEKYLSLAEWIEAKSESSEDLMLQMDIEGAEFLTLIAVPRQTLNRFRIVIIELHFLEAFKNRWAFSQIYLPFFDKVLKDFDVVHLHPNNCCGTWTYGDIEFPRIIELTLHRKDRKIHLNPKTTSRNELDNPCVESSPDLALVYSESGGHISVVWD
jgi:hypothetical protein